VDPFISTTLAFAFGFPALLIFVLSRVSGWKELAARYPRTGRAPKPVKLLGYGSMRRWIGYNGALMIAADDEGLYVTPWIFLSWCHRPVLIPWAEIVEARARLTFWTPYYALSLRGLPKTDFALHRRTFEAARPFFARAGVPVVEFPKRP